MEKLNLFRISKRDDMTRRKAWLIRLIAIVAALVVCGIFSLAVVKQNPFLIYGNIFNGAFGTIRKVGTTFKDVSILLIIALALTPAFRMRFWNIGGEGQVLIGGLATAACMRYLGGKMPNALLIIVMFIAAIIAGGIWGLIPAFFKAKWNTNETLATLMMNYIAIQLVAIFMNVWENNKGTGMIGVINKSNHAGWLPEVFGYQYALPMLVAVISTAAMFVYFYYSKQGYEISVVGESVNTARYVGIKVNRVIMRTMIVSGAVCGIVGFLLVGGIDHTITTTSAGGRGFTAVMVSWLAKFNPIYMVLSSLLIVFLGNGASEVAKSLQINESFSDILTGIIIFFVIGSEFFISYKLHIRSNEKKGGK